MAGLVKLVNVKNIKEGERIVKDCYERCVVLIRAPEDHFYCIEVPDTSFADADVEKLQIVPGVLKHSVYKDTDGTLWVNLQENRKPVDRPQPGEGLNVSSVVSGVSQEPPPPPLVPFAGLDRKPMAPSPAKPFQIPASPLKPSPFKERVDTATDAVVRKNWTSRQAQMGALFGSKKPPAAPALAPAAVTGGTDI